MNAYGQRTTPTYSTAMKTAKSLICMELRYNKLKTWETMQGGDSRAEYSRFCSHARLPGAGVSLPEPLLRLVGADNLLTCYAKPRKSFFTNVSQL